MGLFDNNRRNKHINSLTKQEIENEIIEKKRQIGQIKKEVETARTEIAKVNKQHVANVKALDEKQEAFKQENNIEQEKLNKELTKLENKQAKYSKEHEARQEEINEKIKELKNKKKHLLDQKLDLDKASFERKKKNIEKNLEELKVTKKKQEDDFETKLAALQANYEKLTGEKKAQLDKAKEIKQEVQIKTNEKTDELITNEAKKKHQRALKQLADDHRNTMNEIKAEEENKLKAKKAELNDLYIETDSLTTLRNNLMKELDSTKIRSEHEYETLSIKYEAEKAKLIKENDILANDLNSKQKHLEQQVEKEKLEYNNKLEELEYLFGTLTEKRNAIGEDFKKQLNGRNIEYDKYLEALDESYISEKSKLEEEYNTLKYNLSQEEEQLRNRNAFLNERYKNRDAQYKKNIEDYNVQVLEAENDLIAFENECSTRIANFKKDLEKINNENTLAIERQNEHYAEIISSTKNEYSLRRKEINENISQTKINIENINVEIEKLKNDLEDYKAQYEKKRATLDKEHASYLNNVANKKADLQKSIASLVEIMKENENKHAQSLSEIESKKQEITEKHESEVADIKSEHSETIKTLNAEHADAIAKAEREHNIKLEKIVKKYETDVANANSAYASKQKEYEDEKTKLEADLDNLHQETQNKINQLQAQKSDILNTISNLRKDAEEKQIEFDSEVKRLETEHIAKLDEMAKAQDEALAKISSDYEHIPNKELTAVRTALDAKQKEYNDNAAEVALKKQNIENEYQSVVNAMNVEKEKVDKDLVIVNRELERVKRESEKLEADLNTELDKRKHELEDYKDDLAMQIQAAKDEKAAEVEKVSKQLEDEYNSVEKQYADKQVAISKQYDEEIKIHQADLDAKYENLNSLINEINQRRENTEREYIAKYNIVADSTKVAQQELDALVNQNNLRRSELAASIEQKKADNNAEIENIKNDYNNALNEKKQAYDEYISGVRETCNNLRKEISNLEKEKEIETSKLETFANEKLTAMANLEKETALYIENVKNKMDSIAAQQIALESAHSKRVATIKSQIASTMSDYDTLLRTRTTVVSDAVGDNDEELTNKAIAFRERLNALEESHKQILIDLDNKRNETLEKIAAEIEELDASKPERLKSYEDEIASISIAYDKMLRDEQNKQERINDLISQAKKEQDEMFDENNANFVNLEKDLINAKKLAASENEENIKNSANEFNATTASLKEEFDKLVAEKKNLSKNLASLADKFTRIDNEVFTFTVELKDKYMAELLKVRQVFEENRIRKQKELSTLDAMSGEVDDIFKNFN